MDEELKQRLTKYLDTLEDSLAKGADWTAEQAPLIVQEYLAWEFWIHTIGGVLCGVGIVISLIMLVLGIKKLAADSLSNAGFSLVLVSSCLLVLSFVGVCANSHDALKVSIAPRVVILEKVQEFVK